MKAAAILIISLMALSNYAEAAKQMPSPSAAPAKSPKPTPTPAAAPVNTKECLNSPPGPPQGKKSDFYPKSGNTVVTLNAKGDRLFWCHSGLIELNGKGKPHGDGKATLKSTDGLWSGNFIYRPEDGLSQWTITNKDTGKTQVVVGAQVPVARLPAPNGSPLTWDRRAGEESTGPMPKINWIVRTNTTSGDVPYKCKQDFDVKVPFTAVFEFISCYE